jgi:macrolide transport system ATP-binding/permease protein
MAIIKLENIHKTYYRGSTPVPVLKGVSLEINQGEMVAIMGQSGSGKTTLLNLLGCLDRPTEGRYWLDGKEVSRLDGEEQARVRNGTLGFVFQNFNLLARSTALENVAMPLAYNTPPMGDRACQKRGENRLERVGLADRMDHTPARLSGGQQQRVAVARALVNSPRVLFADEPTGNLDSKTSEEILALFQELNRRQNITVIIVTHDEKVAHHAQRIIRIKDGLIEHDGPSANHQLGNADDDAAPDAPDDARPGLFAWLNLGVVLRPVRMALQALRRNILRSVLTTLGIIIGIAALIAIVEIGKGSSASIKEVLTNMGASNVVVQAGKQISNGVNLGSGATKTLTPGDAEAIRRECLAVSGVAPVVRARSQVIYGNHNWSPTYVYGTTPGFLDVRDWSDLEQGSKFTDQDVLNAKQVCLLGQTVVQELFGNAPPIGKEVYIQNVPLQVVGVLTRKGVNLMGLDQDDILIAPWTTIRFRVTGSTGASNPSTSGSPTDPGPITTNARYPSQGTSLYPTPSAVSVVDRPQLVRFSNVDFILVRTETPEDIPSTIAQIKDLLRERHRLLPGDEDDFYARDLTELINAMNSTVTLVTTLLIAVAMICLVVGGVGIMNIMLVSVTERTREIGIRMAVGASGPAILRQFLVEAVVLCLLGGVLGILVGRGTSQLAAQMLNWRTEGSPLAAVAAVVVSVTVGLIFGYYPAWKASRLDPIEALRYE